MKSKVDYFRRSIRLDSSVTAEDEEYNTYTDDDLNDILSLGANTLFNKELGGLNASQFNLVLLYGKKEIYFRLATSSAIHYPISAEGAELKKNYRFNHYSKLIELTNEEFLTMLGKTKGVIGEEEILDSSTFSSKGRLLLNHRKYYREDYVKYYPMTDVEMEITTFAGINLLNIYDEETVDNKYDIYITEELEINIFSPEKLEIPEDLKPYFSTNGVKMIVSMPKEITKGYITLIKTNRYGVKGYSLMTFDFNVEEETGETGEGED